MITHRLSPRMLMAALSAALLAGCTGPAPALVDNAAPFTPKQLKLVERELGGKVAGQPQKCLSTIRTYDSIRVSDTMLIYRANSKLAYRNDLRGSCPGLARDSDVMVIRQFGNQSCAGDFFHLVDRSSGIRGPTCVLGDFTPYRRADEKGS
jgi:hypothetical protein